MIEIVAYKGLDGKIHETELKCIVCDKEHQMLDLFKNLDKTQIIEKLARDRKFVAELWEVID